MSSPGSPDAAEPTEAATPAAEDDLALEEAVAGDTTASAFQLEPEEAAAPDPLTPQFEEPSFADPPPPA
ncbi:MAG: hypothetical protein M3P96_13875 [Actinomycetota bacterium]|nr:hypothetical protein [Actinomycetota bacterium]